MNSEPHSQKIDTSEKIVQIDLLSQVQNLEGQRLALQQELNSLKQRFQNVLKATRDAVWEWDLHENISWYGDGIKVLFGYDWADTTTSVQFWSDRIHPADHERVIAGLQGSLKKINTNWVDRYRFRRAYGTFAWVLDRSSVIHDANGNAVKMVGSMQDITSEVEAKEALRESEEKFRGAFDQLGVGISIADTQGQFLSVNKAYPKIFGYSEEELKSKKISDLSHPDEIEGDRKIIQELLSGKPQVNVREKRYIHKSGKIIWGRVFGTIVKDANGNPKYFVGVLEDITEQRDVLRALKESEERLRLVLDAGKIGTWDFHPQTGNLFWDDRCKELFGLHPTDHADYEIFLQGVHPEDRANADKANQDAMNGIGEGEYELEYRTIGFRDQKLRWVRAKGRSYKDENGVTTRYAGTIIDITDQKHHEQELKEQKERFRLLSTTIPQIVWTTDANGIVDYMSDNWTKYTGQIPVFEKFSFRKLMHPEDLEHILPEWSECMAQGKTFLGEYRLLNIHTQQYRWFNCTTEPLKDDQGNVIKWIGSATDIHDQKLIEFRLEEKVATRTKDLRSINEQLAKSNDELQQYAYVTSHDLKEPLRKIQTFSSIIKGKYKDQISNEASNYIDKIENAASRMSGLINDLLEYSKLSNTDNATTEINLAELINTIKGEFEYTIAEKNIAVNLVDLPVLRGVPVQIHQLFYNLFSNAIKFSRPDHHNRITVKCSRLKFEEQSEYSLLPGTQYYKITIQDEGIGFSAEYSEKIFAIFNRLHNKTEYEGHGIGLALCKKIVSNHKGIIVATGKEKLGATFTIILPIG